MTNEVRRGFFNASGIRRQFSATLEGSIFVAGTTTGDVFRLNADGSQYTQDNWPYSPATDANPLDLTCDSTGNVYIAYQDNTARKINSDGTEAWSFTNHTSSVFAIEVDDSGNVYTAGNDSNIFKIDLNGNQVWQFTANGSVQAMAIALSGNIYFYDSTDDAIRKLDNNGNEITTGWPFTNSIGFNCRAITIRNDETVYIAGGNDEIIKVNSDGVEDTSGNWRIGTTTYRNLELDDAGFIYAQSNSPDQLDKFDNETGGLIWSNTNTTVALATNPSIFIFSNDDINNLLRKINPDGTEYTQDNWPVDSSSFGGTAGYIAAIPGRYPYFWDTFNPSADNYVVGGVEDTSIARLTETATADWTTDTGGFVDHVRQDLDGNTLVLSNADATLRKYDFAGNEITSGGFPNSISSPNKGLAIDSNEFIYCYSESNSQLKKLNSDGTENTTGNWPVNISISNVDKIITTRLDKIVITNAETTGSTDGLIQINNDGTTEWTITAPDGVGFFGVAVDIDENIITGIIDLSSGFAPEVRKYDRFGNEITSGNFPITGLGEVMQDIIIDANNDIFAQGGSNWYKFDSTGTQQFSGTYTGGTESSIAIDTPGNIYVGSYDASPENSPAYIQKFDSAGNELTTDWPYQFTGDAGAFIDITYAKNPWFWNVENVIKFLDQLYVGESLNPDELNTYQLDGTLISNITLASAESDQFRITLEGDHISPAPNNMYKSNKDTGDVIWNFSCTPNGPPEVDKNGNVYFYDDGLNQIRKINSDGTEDLSGNWPLIANNFLTSGLIISSNDYLLIIDGNDPTEVRKFSLSDGSEVTTGNFPVSYGSFPNTATFYVDKDDNFYGVHYDGADYRIFKHDINGNLLNTSAPFQPDYLVTDFNSNVYATNDTRTGVRKFDSNLNEITSQNWGNITFSQTRNITIDSNNNPYLIDAIGSSDYRVRKFDSEGNEIGSPFLSFNGPIDIIVPFGRSPFFYK